ncbi:MAG: hypothetical protein ACRDAQ_11210 [Cetobacterium sp.]
MQKKLGYLSPADYEKQSALFIKLCLKT